ncbi:MAG TPA: hypothetical protein VGK01_24055, partial [Candidatus Angelobacter sp.]
MTKRLLVAAALWFVMANCLSQEARGQGTQPPSSNDQQSAQAQDQQARPQSTAAPSRDAKKGTASNATVDQSSTVGDPATSVPLNVKSKLRYFAVESFRPGIYPV